MPPDSVGLNPAERLACERAGADRLKPYSSRYRDKMQARIYGHARAVFGDHAMTPRERVLRFIEEAMELAQSLDVPEVEVINLMAYVYNRPKGEPFQEVGGVSLTLMGLSQALGFSTDQAEDAEYERFLKIDPDKFRAKHKTKVAAGVAAPLPKED